MSIGKSIYSLIKKLWPLNRSITGDGLRESLSIIKDKIPEMQIKSIKSGTKVYDWVVPEEWSVKSAYILTPKGEKICDFKKNNLHLVGYSVPVNKKMNLSDLKKHLHTLPDQPNAIPYITSYYNRTWGFCISFNEYNSLTDGEYYVNIESEHFNGELNYGELLIQGLSKKEVFLSTYICHPSMANNELSGPCLLTFISIMLKKNQSELKYSYRIIFIPETIGSISYLSLNLSKLKKNVIAGYNISCIGDDRCYSFLPSRKGGTLSDKVAVHVLKWTDPNYNNYNWSDRGSDERQYCSPGVDLPISSLMRSKYREYPEYHTSLDKLDTVVTEKGLEESYNLLVKIIESIEKNIYPKITTLCEPNMGRRGLYPTLSTKESNKQVSLMMDLLSWSDGDHSLIDIADKINVPVWTIYDLVNKLISEKLIE